MSDYGLLLTGDPGAALPALASRLRAHACRAFAAAALLAATLPASAALFDDVAAKASELSRTPYRAAIVAARSEAAATSASLTYDQYRDICFRPDHALWR